MPEMRSLNIAPHGAPLPSGKDAALAKDGYFLRCGRWVLFYSQATGNVCIKARYSPDSTCASSGLLACLQSCRAGHTRHINQPLHQILHQGLLPPMSGSTRLHVHNDGSSNKAIVSRIAHGHVSQGSNEYNPRARQNPFHRE